MKKFEMLGMALCVALAFGSCKASESAYKKAYEKAKQQELAEAEAPAPAVETPVKQTPVVEAPVESKPVSVAPVREEKVTVVSTGATELKDYSVVCGSFSVKANAEGLKDYLDGEGYQAIVVYNADNSMYRVVVSTYSDHAEASRARDAFKAKYPQRADFQGSWLLRRIY